MKLTEIDCQKSLQKHIGSSPATYFDSLVNDTHCPTLNEMGKCLSSMLMTVNLLIHSTVLLRVRTPVFQRTGGKGQGYICKLEIWVPGRGQISLHIAHDSEEGKLNRINSHRGINQILC